MCLKHELVKNSHQLRSTNSVWVQSYFIRIKVSFEIYNGHSMLDFHGLTFLNSGFTNEKVEVIIQKWFSWTDRCKKTQGQGFESKTKDTFSSPSSSVSSHGMYRVLTPTMYRSRMACARQALSMDYEDGDRAKIRREGPSIRRDPSPFSRGRPGDYWLWFHPTVLVVDSYRINVSGCDNN